MAAASVDGTVRVAAMVFFILMNSTVFSQLLAFSGATAGMLEWATSFEAHRLTILLVMFVVLILLGMFMDAVSMMLITVPIFFPLAQQLGFDLVWFGLFVLITIEMAGTTPPFGPRSHQAGQPQREAGEPDQDQDQDGVADQERKRGGGDLEQSGAARRHPQHDIEQQAERRVAAGPTPVFRSLT